MDAGIVLSLVAVLIALGGLVLNGRKESRSDAAATAIMQTKLDSVLNGVTDIRVELQTMRDKMSNYGERLAKVESRAASNTHRLDQIDGRKDGEE